MREWTDELQELELPFRAFFARHRPLMVMEKTSNLGASSNSNAEKMSDFFTSYAGSSSSGSRQPRYVHVWGPGNNVYEGGRNSVVSYNIAQELGAFDPSKIHERSTEKKSASSSYNISSHHNQVTGCTVMNLDGEGINDDATTVIMARTRTNESALEAVISFLNDKVEFEHQETSEIQATSVKRKRKLKMNRHKYRKRLKAQRALRKRLGK